MTNLGAAIVWGLAIAASLVAGGVVASAVGLPARAAAAITAFGGGVLLAAIALELVPEADERAGVALTAAGLLAGTLVYVAADAWLSRDEDMMAMRRMAHAAAAGRAMPMRIDRAAAARGESIAVGMTPTRRSSAPRRPSRPRPCSPSCRSRSSRTHSRPSAGRSPWPPWRASPPDPRSAETTVHRRRP